MTVQDQSSSRRLKRLLHFVSCVRQDSRKNRDEVLLHFVVATSKSLPNGTFPTWRFTWRRSLSVVYHWLLRGIFRRNFGKLFVDVVDCYSFVGTRKIPTYYQVITQNQAQAALYPHHGTHIIMNWYNSYPADFGRDVQLPPIAVEQTLNVATIWDPEPDQAGCRTLRELQNVRYDCIEENFHIEKWYHKYGMESREKVKEVLADPNLGPGFLYQQLFRQYHVLVAFAKSGDKLKYGNVQRIVSQMRSGVPILVEDRGDAFHEFITSYSYSCTFQPTDESFRHALERMKFTSLRQKYQQQAVWIVGMFV
jgi:hypothetical protein